MKVDRNLWRAILKDFSWSNIKRVLIMDNSPHGEFSLEKQIEEAKQAWLIAQRQMDWADKDLLESAILYTTTCERRYMGLMQKAKAQGFTSWKQSDLTAPSPSSSPSA
ncbi:hypothetical protein [Desulforamulus ruminis]|uniref:DUF2508 family protein n=1 Tax=Desulforamulus ruminis (strain ATCC 23193 / DSM 2154 / NCIMB 8452 / DL) TaxID=696281 RepID=F6DV44_DESRL|nr:hypothetical protein [Desulforamulus ruminis]AEG59110.1 hypothetical protein Desru_0831 [Desulforamulus ruminis DSM 2154]